MRYQRPLAASINWWQICEDLSSIESDCADVRWMVDDEEQLIDLLDGDEEQAFEFKLAFSDLAADCGRMQDEMDELRRYDFMSGDDDDGAPIFDLLFPATRMDDSYLGFDAYEGDYYRLTSFAADAAQDYARKKLMRLTKESLLDLCGTALGIARNYMSLMYRYQSMRASLDVLKGTNESLIKVTKAVDEAYEKCADDPYDFKAKSELDRILMELPERLWIE